MPTILKTAIRTAAIATALTIAIPLGVAGLGGNLGWLGSASAEGQKGDSPGKGGPNKGSGDDRGKDGQRSGPGEDKVLRGKRDSGQKGPTAAEEDSDRRGPAYKGGRDTGKPTGAGTKKGSTYADLWVILRDANGLPILTAQGYVQPVDVNGAPIPLNADGTPVDPTKLIEVELSRLNVGRSPKSVLDRQLADVVKTINSATAITTDTAGRIVVTIGTETKTIDSPLANLAIYKTLIEKGYIPGITTTINFGSLTFLKDGVLNTQDFSAASSFLAAAADKSGKILPDTVVYMNQILQVGGSTTFTYVDGKVYVRYPTDLTYTRTAYNVMVDVLVKQTDGSYVKTPVNLVDAVFGGVTFASQPLTGFTAFTQAADDARAVIQFLHDNPLPSN